MVGIRKSNPGYPLEIGGSTGLSGINYAFFGYDTQTQTVTTNREVNVQSTQNYTVSSDEVIRARQFHAFSDSRIKKNIVDLSDNECLEKLRLLKPCKYQYIDTIKNGEEYVYGFIAQEVKDVINLSVGITPQIIPDYYNIVEISNVDASFIEFDLSDNIQYDLSLNQTIRVIVDYSANIDDVEHTYKQFETSVISIQGKTIKIENEANSEYIHKIFLYGKEVENFHNLKKDAIWTVATSALQEVDRIQQRHQEEITQLTDEMNTLKSQYQLLV